MTQTLKNLIRKIPFLHGLLHPVVIKFRQARHDARERKRAREIENFRSYCRQMAQQVGRPVFVKVGANDGIGDDPCSDLFLADKSWSGLMIEPVPFWFEKLRENFKETDRFRFAQVAIGSPAGEATFYHVDPKARERAPRWEDWYDKLGSFDRKHIVKHVNGFLEPYIVETKVRVCRLQDLLREQNISTIDLLHIDAEGFDYEVLKTLDFSQSAPRCILIEHFHLKRQDKDEMLLFLNRNGYTVRDCLSDYFAFKPNK